MKSLITKLKDLFQSVVSGLGTIYELFTSLSKSKFWWLAPMLVALIGCGIFLVLVNTVTTTMPFVYALF